MTGLLSTGGDVDSYCSKCRLNLEHIILAMVGSEIVKVKCKTCGGTHKFRGMPVSRPAAGKKSSAGARSLADAQTLWSKYVSEASGPETAYAMDGVFHSGDLLMHNTFGKGVVKEVWFNRCSVIFQDKERVLVTANT